MGTGFARRLVKEATARMAHHTGLRKSLAAWRRRHSGGRRILIVSYHRVVEDFTGEVQRSIPGLLISRETFQKHLETAHAEGFAFATLGEALSVLSGERAAPRDLFVVTFDDGYRDVYRSAYPVLKKMGIPSTLYLPAAMIGTSRRFNHDRLFHLIRVLQQRKHKLLYEALPPAAAALLVPILSRRKTLSQALDDFIGEHQSHHLTEVIDGLERQLGGGEDLLPEQGDLCSWDEIRQMGQDGGMSFGGHTLGHVVLTLEPMDTVEHELRESKAWIEREVGQPVRDFAYCNGWYSDDVIQALVRCGFRSGVTTEDMPNRMGGDPFTLKRKVLWENFSRGPFGDYSAALTACHFDDVFSALGVARAVPGKRPQRPTDGATANAFVRERFEFEVQRGPGGS